MIKLKSWSHFFQAIKAGRKLHDLRFKGDRTFKVGDILILEEYDPFLGRYTGDSVKVEVTFITDDVTPCAFSSAVLPKDYCILSIRLVPSEGFGPPSPLNPPRIMIVGDEGVPF